jgi:hypothetical protein
MLADQPSGSEGRRLDVAAMSLTQRHQAVLEAFAALDGVNERIVLAKLLLTKMDPPDPAYSAIFGLLARDCARRREVQGVLFQIVPTLDES